MPNPGSGKDEEHLVNIVKYMNKFLPNGDSMAEPLRILLKNQCITGMNHRKKPLKR